VASYSYSCRDKNWAIKRGSIQAESREDALRLLKAQGFAPLTVTEGSALRATDASPKMFRFVFALVAAVIVGGGLLAVMRNQPKRPAKFAEKQPAAKPKKTVAAPKKERAPVALSQPAPAPGVAKTLPPPVVPASAPSQPQAVTKAPQAELMASPQQPPPEEQKIEVRTMTSASEQLISMLGLPGEERPPLPLQEEDSLESDFDQAATNVILVTDDDNDMSIANKANVATVKEYIKQARKMGWTPGEYIRELEKKRLEEAAERLAAQEILSEVEGTAPKEAQTARDELNKELEKKGILPLDPPPEE
jgi:hypothetical protein